MDVVCVGNVWMRVPLGLMPMWMAVLASSNDRVCMPVMSVVVAMRVLMLQPLVRVVVAMRLNQVQDHARQHQDAAQRHQAAG